MCSAIYIFRNRMTTVSAGRRTISSLLKLPYGENHHLKIKNLLRCRMVQQQQQKRIPSFFIDTCITNNEKKKFLHSSNSANPRFVSEDEEVSDANKRTKDSVVIRSTPDNRGWGVYASKSYNVGDTVIQSKPISIVSKQGTHTIQIDWKIHIIMDLPSRFLNHNCGYANVAVRPNISTKSYDFIAMKPIKEFDELLLDYETTEYESITEDGMFPCECGAPNCRGTLRGFKYHGDKIVKLYGKEYVSPYLFTSKP